MAAKKDKFGIEALRADVQALSDAFWKFRDGMLADAAVQQAEEQVLQAAALQELPDISDADIDETAGLMAALGQPQRLRMMIMLARNPVSVNDLVEQLGLTTTGAAYHHIKVLSSHGLVEQPQRGTFALTNSAAPRVHHLLSAVLGVEIADTGDEKKSAKKKKKSS